MELGNVLQKLSGVAFLLLLPCCKGLPLSAADPASTRTVPVLGLLDPPPVPLQAAQAVTPGQLRKQAAASYARFNTYIARFVRHGPSGNKGEEILAFYFRKHPWSVRFRWLAGEGQGREVLYVQGHFDDKLHIILAPGDAP